MEDTLVDNVHNCPNYDLLEELLNNWKISFGFSNEVISKLKHCSSVDNVYDTITQIIKNPLLTIDCETAKIIFRIVIKLKNKHETIKNYCEWRDIGNLMGSTWPTFLMDNDDFDYIEVCGLPGIMLDDLPSLNKCGYIETYWYSPSVTAYILNNDTSIIEHPGVHCIYNNGIWTYFDQSLIDGTSYIVRTPDVNMIMDRITNYCVGKLGMDPGIIFMNPEDTRICFND